MFFKFPSTPYIESKKDKVRKDKILSGNAVYSPPVLSNLTISFITSIWFTYVYNHLKNCLPDVRERGKKKYSSDIRDPFRTFAKEAAKKNGRKKAYQRTG